MVKISSIHIPDPSRVGLGSIDRIPPELEGSVRTWSIPITDDGNFELTQHMVPTVTAWDPGTSSNPEEYECRLLNVTATGKVTSRASGGPYPEMRDIQIKLIGTHQTRAIIDGTGEEHTVKLPFAVEVQTCGPAAMPLGLHETLRSDRTPIRHLLIMEVP